MMSFHNLSYPGPFELIWSLISFALVVGFVLLVIVALTRRHHAPYAPPSSALTILEERYARGEINRDEFFERREVLLRKDAPRN